MCITSVCLQDVDCLIDSQGNEAATTAPIACERRHISGRHFSPPEKYLFGSKGRPNYICVFRLLYQPERIHFK